MAFLGKETCSADPCTQSACKLQESQSVFEQGLLSKPACIISPLRQPACIVTVWGEARGGEQITKIFRKISVSAFLLLHYATKTFRKIPKLSAKNTESGHLTCDFLAAVEG